MYARLYCTTSLPTYQTSSLSTAPRLLPVKYEVLSILSSTLLDFLRLFLPLSGAT